MHKNILIIYPNITPVKISDGTTRSLLNILNLFNDDFNFIVYTLVKVNIEEYLIPNVKVYFRDSLSFFAIYNIIKKFTGKLNFLINQDEDYFNHYSENAFQYAKEYYSNDKKQYLKLFA